MPSTQIFDSVAQSLTASEEMVDFVKANADNDPVALRLTYCKGLLGNSAHNNKLSFDPDFAILQIECRKKYSRKLPAMLSFDSFLFPNKIAAEQASHQEVAEINARIIGSGHRILDLTAGLGIDSLSFVSGGNLVTSIEIDSWKCDVLRHNARVVLGDDKCRFLEVECGDSYETVAQLVKGEYDTVYIDPSRRNSDRRKVHALSDCQPDILKILPELKDKVQRVFIKTSPLLDVREGCRELACVERVYAVSWHGECKELLFECRTELPEVEKTAPGGESIKLTAINILTNGSIKQVEGQTGSNSIARDLYIQEDTDFVGKYIYEPNSAVMKLSLFGILHTLYPELKKIAPNTHLFVSDALYEDFPGRICKVFAEHSSKSLKPLKGQSMSVVCRNYPRKAQELRSDLKLKEDPNRFLYAFRTLKKPRVLDTELVEICRC